MDDFITIMAAAADITTGAATARIAIPTDLAGAIPRFIRVSSTNAARVRMGVSTVNALATDTLVQPADAMIMHVPQGVTHIAAIQDSAAGKVNVAPLENC